MTPDSSTPIPPVAGTPVAFAAPAGRGWLLTLGTLVVLALVLALLLWQRLSAMQEQLARQSADSGAQSVEARTVARQAQEQVRETAARLAVLEARVSEVALQRSQLDELMQSLSRARDENLVVDIESAIRLAQQQSQLTGSVEPLLAALKTAEQRIARAAQPRLAPVRRALESDMARIKATVVTDTPALLLKLDELVRLADELPLANAVGAAPVGAGGLGTRVETSAGPWWERGWQLLREEARALVRVSRIEQPEAMLLSPEQSFFLRENFKLKLLNARLGLLSRQTDAARADLAAAAAALGRYFDGASRKTQGAVALLQQIQGQMKTLDLPRVDETLAALTTAAAGR